MPARKLDGALAAAAIRQELAPDVEAFTVAAGRRPRLTIVLVGDDPASHVYVRNKERAATETGLDVVVDRLPADDAARCAARARRARSMTIRIATASSCRRRFRPPWARMRASACSTRLQPAKDVDGFHPRERRPAGPRAGDARAVYAVRRHRTPDTRERSRSPARTRWSSAGARSSANPWRCCSCSGTPPSRFATRERVDLPSITSQADILVAAIGRPGFVTAGHDQARRGGCGRGHDADQRPRGGRATLRGRQPPAGGVRQEGIDGGRRRPSRMPRKWRAPCRRCRAASGR